MNEKTRSIDCSDGVQDEHAAATEDVQRQMLQEFKELEEQKTKEELELVPYVDQVGEVQGRVAKTNVDSNRSSGLERNDNSSFGSCSSSLAFDTHEVMSASSQMTQDVDEPMSGSSWTALAKERREEVGGALTRRVKRRSWRSQVRGPGLKADPWIPMRKMGHRSARTNAAREESEKPKED